MLQLHKQLEKMEKEFFLPSQLENSQKAKADRGGNQDYEKKSTRFSGPASTVDRRKNWQNEGGSQGADPCHSTQANSNGCYNARQVGMKTARGNGNNERRDETQDKSAKYQRTDRPDHHHVVARDHPSRNEKTDEQEKKDALQPRSPGSGTNNQSTVSRSHDTKKEQQMLMECSQETQEKGNNSQTTMELSQASHKNQE